MKGDSELIPNETLPNVKSDKLPSEGEVVSEKQEPVAPVIDEAPLVALDGEGIPTDP